MSHVVLTDRREDEAGTRVSSLARWAMVLGIAAIPLAIVYVGMVVGAIGLVLGIVAYRAIQKDPGRLAGVGFARAGIAASSLGIFVLPILMALFMPSMGKSRELANRAVCAANITGTVKGFVVYANENFDVFPTAGVPAKERGYAVDLGTLGTSTDPDTALNEIQTAKGAAGNPMSAMWMLVLRMQEMPKNLMCKSAAGGNAKPSPMTDGTHYYLNPKSAEQISYSIAYPYKDQKDVGGWWKNTTLSDLPVMSDMSPLEGTGTPKRVLVPAAAPKDVRTVNSGNHSGMGQNVGFADAHVEWVKNPLVGEATDEIWTVQKAEPLVAGYAGDVIAKGGEVPHYPPTAVPPYDTIMVPVRDLGTGAIK